MLRTLLLCLATVLVPASAWAFAVQGVNLTSWGHDDYGAASARATVDWARCLGATDIAIMTESIVDPDTDEIRTVEDLAGPDEDLLRIMRYARSAGLRVTVKPHYLSASSGDNLQYPIYTPRSMTRFFDAYSRSILRHAAIAAEGGATRLVIGTEMGGQITGRANHDRWALLIGRIRRVFHGRLTYAAGISATWPASPSANEAAFVSFWPLLDEVGINLYPRLTTKDGLSAAELRRRFHENDLGESIVAQMRSLGRSTGMPVLLTETGFRSKDGALDDQGDWNTGGTPNEAVQANALGAEIGVLGEAGRGWLEGMFLWNAPVSGPASRTGFDFRGKQAEKVVRRAFGGGSPSDCR
jgi:hypothetical protein